MNINIYIEDELGSALNQLAKIKHMSRNALIREAIKTWLLQNKTKKWPPSVLKYTGIGMQDITPFEFYRNTLSEPKDDPLS